MRREDEIEAFKTNINLSEYAASQGYWLDKKTSSRNCAIMRSNSDKVIIIKNFNQHWIYFSVDHDKDNGSIIDFVQNRQNLNLGEVRMELRPWLGKTPMPQIRERVGASYVSDLLPISNDLGKVRAQFAAMKTIDAHHRYLEQERHIPSTMLALPRFASRIYIDKYNNAVFPHFDREGVCGYELRNSNFKGFSPNGRKGLWSSRIFEDDNILVIAEATIDGLSYAALFPQEQARYISTGGELSPLQSDLIKSAIEKMPNSAEIIVTADHDDGGKKLAEKIKAIFAQISPQERILRVHMPDATGDDWNDVLRASMANSKKEAPQPV